MEKNIPGVLLVGGGVVMKGIIEAPQTIVNSGQIEGNVKAHSIFVEETGQIRGKIEASLIDVSGIAKDQVIAQENLIVRSTGSIDGNISYLDLTVEKSGKISGTLIALENYQSYTNEEDRISSEPNEVNLDPNDEGYEDGEHS